MEALKKADSVIGKITKAVCWISFAGVIIMMMLNVVDVILNKIMGKPILGTYEITQRVLMCTVFASFAYAQTKKTHINMTILIAHFPRVIRFILFSLMGLLSILAAGALTWAAFVQAGVALSSGTCTEVLYIPLYPFYYLETAAMAIFTFALIFDTVLYVKAIFSEECAEYVQKDWS